MPARPELSRRLGIDTDQVLRWQTTDGFAHELLGGRYDGSHLLDYFTATQSTMPFAPNDYASKEQPAALSEQPEQGRQESDKAVLAKCGLITAVLSVVLTVLGSLLFGCKAAETTNQTRHVTPAHSRPRISLLHHDVERANPLPRPGKHDWQYID